MSSSRLETDVEIEASPESDIDYFNNDNPSNNERRDETSPFPNVILHPRRLLNKACQVWNDRNRTSSPRQQRGMVGVLNKKKSLKKNRKSKHGSSKTKRSHETSNNATNPTNNETTSRPLRNSPIREIDPSTVQTNINIQRPTNERQGLTRVRFGDNDDEVVFMNSYLASTNKTWTGRHPLVLSKTPMISRKMQLSNGVEPTTQTELETPLSTPLVCFNMGRFFGRALVSSGTLQVQTPVPQRHNEVITPWENETRQALRVSTPGRFGGNSSTRSITIPSLVARSPEIQRPLSGLPPHHSATTAESMNQLFQFSSPQLNPSSPHNLEVLGTDQLLAGPEQSSPLEAAQVSRSEVEGSLNHSSHDPPYDSAIMEDCMNKISELQIELEMTRSEAELERSERQKFQKLYEGSVLCQICMEKKRNSFILPCSHFVYCFECLERHWEINEFRQCPLCRGPAHSVVITNLD
eukprot:g4579.t1